MKKLNSMRKLESMGIEYEVHRFDPDIRSASGVAAALGLPAERVFKSLVASEPDGRLCIAILAAEDRLDTKALARALGVKKVTMASKREAERRTGMRTGGISALGMKPGSQRVLLDQKALELSETLLVSAGRRGCNLELLASALIEATEARLADISAHGNTP